MQNITSSRPDLEASPPTPERRTSMMTITSQYATKYDPQSPASPGEDTQMLGSPIRDRQNTLLAKERLNNDLQNNDYIAWAPEVPVGIKVPIVQTTISSASRTKSGKRTEQDSLHPSRNVGNYHTDYNGKRTSQNNSYRSHSKHDSHRLNQVFIGLQDMEHARLQYMSINLDAYTDATPRGGSKQPSGQPSPQRASRQNTSRYKEIRQSQFKPTVENPNMIFNTQLMNKNQKTKDKYNQSLQFTYGLQASPMSPSDAKHSRNQSIASTYMANHRVDQQLQQDGIDIANGKPLGGQFWQNSTYMTKNDIKSFNINKIRNRQIVSLQSYSTKEGTQRNNSSQACRREEESSRMSPLSGPSAQYNTMNNSMQIPNSVMSKIQRNVRTSIMCKRTSNTRQSALGNFTKQSALESVKTDQRRYNRRKLPISNNQAHRSIQLDVNYRDTFEKEQVSLQNPAVDTVNVSRSIEQTKSPGGSAERTVAASASGLAAVGAEPDIAPGEAVLIQDGLSNGMQVVQACDSSATVLHQDSIGTSTKNMKVYTSAQKISLMQGGTADPPINVGGSLASSEYNSMNQLMHSIVSAVDSPKKNTHLHKMVNADQNIKSQGIVIIQKQKKILKEPQTIETYKTRFEDNSLMDFNLSLGSSTSPQYNSGYRNNPPMSPEHRTMLLMEGTNLKQAKLKKSLYDHTNAALKLKQKLNLSKMDRCYKENTMFSTEVQQQLRKYHKARGSSNMDIYKQKRNAANWTCGRTISEMNSVDHSIKKQLAFATVSGLGVLDNTFKQQVIKNSQPRKTLEMDDIGSRELFAIKNRYKDENLYHRRSLLEKKNDLNFWRDEMKVLEDKHERNVYDRFAKNDKTLLQERIEAQQENLALKNHHRYKIEKPDVYKNYGVQKFSSTLDVYPVTQSSKRSGEMNLNRSILQHMETQDLSQKAKKKIQSVSKKIDLLLHPLQWEQNLETMKQQRAQNTIMRDFSIDQLTEQNILEKQSQEFSLKEAQEQQDDRAVTAGHLQARNKLVNFCPDKYPISPKCYVQTQLLPIQETKQNPHAKAQNLKNEISEIKKDGLLIEDQVREHIKFFSINGFDKMARVKLNQAIFSNRTNDTIAMAEQKATYKGMNDEEIMGQLFKDNMQDTFKKNLRGITMKAVVNIQGQNSDIWAEVISKSKSPNKQRKKTKQDLKFQAKRKELHCLCDSFFAEEKRKDQVSAKNENAELVGSNAMTVMELIRSTSVCNMNHENVMQIIKYFTHFSCIFAKLKTYVILDLSKNKKLTPEIELALNNLFLDEAFLGKILGGSSKIIDYIQYVRESVGNDTFINYIFEGSVSVTNTQNKQYMQTLRPSHFFELNQEIQKKINFRINEEPLVGSSTPSSCVLPIVPIQVLVEENVVPGSPQVILESPPPETQELNSPKLEVNIESQAATPTATSHILGSPDIGELPSSPTTGGPSTVDLSGKKSGMKNGPLSFRGTATFLKFSLKEITQAFLDQIHIQYQSLRLELMRFPLLRNLNHKDYSYLASLGQSKTKVHEYLPDEVIVDEGFDHMDHFYLVIQGRISMEKTVFVQNKNVWNRAAHQTKKISQSHGEITAREYFGLKEMLYKEVQKKSGQSVFLPCQAKYKVINSETGTKVIRINYQDFKKVVAKSDLARMMSEFENDYKSISDKEKEIQDKLNSSLGMGLRARNPKEQPSPTASVEISKPSILKTGSPKRSAEKLRPSALKKLKPK